MNSVIVETNRVVLCRPSMDDVDALFGLWSDPETMRYIGDGNGWPRERIVERTQKAIRVQTERGMCFWTARLKKCGSVIGQGGLVPIAFDGDEIELGYRLGKAYWGKGYATEIARAAAEYGLGELGLTDLVAVCFPENVASRRVLKKVGFVEVGESGLYYGVPTVVYRMGAWKEKN